MTVSQFTAPGSFVVGANYWASHAGTAMWRDWRPDIVDDDLRRLSAAGLQILRVFPLWPDFQPIHLLRGGGGHPIEVRFGEAPLPDDELGQAGLSAVMMDRFQTFLDLAQKHGLGFDIGLLTGWMSGRLHVPPALEGRHVLTDPFAIRWSVRFVRQFVRAFRDHPAVAAWDLGNECNCMAQANRDEAYCWTAQIVDAIRAEDPAHPVISGLHSLSPTGSWTMLDQGELTDLLTTHPYPVFTPHCNQDPVNTIRTILHSTAESRYYADLGGKPCLCQEIGTLGPVIASEAIAADFIRSCLFSLWANDCHGLFWWCAHEQTELQHAPYDWHAVERELGLMRVDKSPKPVLDAIGAFRAMLDSLPLDAPLPVRNRQAVCLLTEGQDTWAVAYSAFILAKQAGFDLEFQHSSQPLREAALYLLPSLCGHAMIPRRKLQELLANVAAGATLYLSLDNGLPSDFEAITGLAPQTREKRVEWGPLTIGDVQFPSGGEFKVRFAPTRARVLGTEQDGNPAFTVATYGQGQVYFLSAPIELMITRTAGALHRAEAAPFWRIYREIAQDVIASRVVRKAQPMLGVTEHRLDDGRVVVVIVNQSPEPITETLELAEGWSVSDVWHGAAEGASVVVPANDGVVLLLAKG